MATIQDAIGHIESLYPPDSQYPDTAKIGRKFMDDSCGNSIGYDNWRDLPKSKLFLLCRLNLLQEREFSLASDFLLSSVDERMKA